MPGSTTNMGLVTWPLLTDFFSHTDLVNNWTKVDAHDHVPVGSGGNGGAPIPAAGIQNGAVTSSKLASGAALANLANNSIPYTKIAVGGTGLAFGAFLVHKTGANFTQATSTVLPFDTADLDVGSNWDTINSRYTAPVTGAYRFSTFISISGALTATNAFVGVSIRKNGSSYLPLGGWVQPPSVTGGVRLGGAGIVSATAGDTIDLLFSHTSGSNPTIASGLGNTFFCGEIIGRL